MASLGDEAVADAAQRLSQTLRASAGLRLLDLLGEAALEVSGQLPSGHVEVRLAGQEPSLVYVDEEPSEPSPDDGRGRHQRPHHAPAVGGAQGERRGGRGARGRVRQHVDRARAQPRVDRAHNRPSFRSPSDRVRRELRKEPRCRTSRHRSDTSRLACRSPRPEARRPRPRAGRHGREEGAPAMRTETFETPEPPSLRLNLPSGSINVDTSDTAETRIELSGPNEDDARIEYRRNEIVVEIEWKKLFGRANFVRDHRLEIYAPNGSQIDAHTASGDVEGRGTLRRGLDRLGLGRRPSRAGRGRASRCNTASGDVQVEFVGEALRVNSASGDIELGEVESDAKIRTASGDIEIRSAVRARSTSPRRRGDVQVGIRRGSSVYIDASSMSGDMTSEMDVSDAPPVSDGPAVDFRARTMSGDVTVAPERDRRRRTVPGRAHRALRPAAPARERGLPALLRRSGRVARRRPGQPDRAPARRHPRAARGRGADGLPDDRRAAAEPALLAARGRLGRPARPAPRGHARRRPRPRGAAGVDPDRLRVRPADDRAALRRRLPRGHC